MLLLLLAIQAASFPRLDSTEPGNGNGLLHICEMSDIGSTDFCRGYISATYQNSVSDSRLCEIDDGVSAEQMRLVTLKYLKAHPERLHHFSPTLIQEAFREDFPCKPSRAAH